jgi:two-component system, response regulator PdtaR
MAEVAPPRGLVVSFRLHAFVGSVDYMTAAVGINSYSILVTDDELGCREALQTLLAQAGYRTLVATCGEEALEIVRVQRVHAALLDMHMPTLNGLEVIELVRQFDSLMPCILVTADANEGLMRKAFHARVYSVIPKPVSRQIVLYTVLRALERAYGNLQGEGTS